MRIIRLISALVLVAFGVNPSPVTRVTAQGQEQGQRLATRTASRTNSVYIVQMIDAPAGSYVGGVAGLPATKAPRGAKLDPNSPDVVRYGAFLQARHDQALGRSGGRKVYDYRYSFNGFAAELTDAQANALRTAPGVLAVTKDELVNADTVSTPAFLGLSNPGGLWQQLGGIGAAGENMIVGIIDSGIWPENPSFSDRTGTNGNGSQGGKLDYQQIPGWHGKCTPGEAFPASKCNQKLIGAQRFNEAWGGDAGLKAQRPWEFASPRDYNSHGSHTASTAAGNSGVKVPGLTGSISGMAPRARIAVYKALWSTEDAVQAQGFNADLVAAIDQAVADGVDAINYSISGTTSNFLDPVEVAFLFAADAGVFVAAAAGNSGPTTGTVNHPSPWITTVAAGTHSRNGEGSVTLGNGATYAGASLAAAAGPAPFIDASAAGLPGADAAEVALCFSASVVNNGAPVLDPAKVAGKIVLCDRGNNARVDKSLAVRAAGGVGMVLVNVTPNSLNADFHYVSTVHVADTARTALKLYAASPGATARISQATLVPNVPAPLTAAFSSRGPLTAGAGNLLKPDVIAPGQDIIAAVSPVGDRGLNYDSFNGTSMSTPHVAGLSLLLRQLHPDWSPMMIKSALMTTGSDVLDGPNTNSLVIFRQGAGHVRPNGAADPGLVYEHGVNDWLAFLCGTTAGVDPALCTALAGAGYSLDPSNLNGASIAIGTLLGSKTVRRTVTNVSDSTATYNAGVTGMAGFTTVVSPSSLTIGAGQSATFTVTLTRTTATLNAYAGGQLTWSDGTHSVRSPIVARPVALSAPASVSSTGGPISYTVGFGYTGTFTATGRGLIPAVTTTGSVTDDPNDSFSPTGPGVTSFPVTIAAGTTYARFSLFDANVSPASDLDIYVFRNDAAGPVLVATSLGLTSEETANLVNPPAGNYTVYVHGFSVPGTANFTLFSWLLGTASAGNMAVTAPPSATQGATGTITLTFNGLTAGTKYLGSVAYGGTAGLPNPTIVRVDP
jgi:subtilase family protein/fibronectin type III domain protein/PA domain-containing protein/peptidase inhibitor I9